MQSSILQLECSQMIATSIADLSLSLECAITLSGCLVACQVLAIRDKYEAPRNNNAYCRLSFEPRTFT